MANHLTLRQKKHLVGKLKTFVEKLARGISHKLYLEECISKGLFPRALNVASQIKSLELRGSQGCFDILKEASDKLVSNQLRKWDLRVGQLNHQKDVFIEKLRSGLNQEDFEHEKTLLSQHSDNVMNVEKINKRRKIERDTNEFTIIESQFITQNKRQRRFKRREVVNVNNVVIDFNANPECRITGKVKNLSSRPLEVPEQELMEMWPKFSPVEPDIDRARFQKDLN